jgi:hypothetical protein
MAYLCFQLASSVAQKVFDDVTMATTHEVAAASLQDYRLAVTSRTLGSACLLTVIMQQIK